MSYLFPVLTIPLALLALISFMEAAELVWRRRGQEAWAYLFSGLWLGVVYGSSFYVGVCA